MEYPVPDLIYYKRIVDNEKIPEEHVRYELNELISEVKIYMGTIQKHNRKRDSEIKYEIKRITHKNIFNTLEKHGGMLISACVVMLIILMFCV